MSSSLLFTADIIRYSSWNSGHFKNYDTVYNGVLVLFFAGNPGGVKKQQNRLAKNLNKSELPVAGSRWTRKV